MINQKEFEVKLEEFRKKIIKQYKEIEKIQIGQNIYRGHIETMASCFENEFTRFIAEVLNSKEYEYYIDYTLEKRRPDLLITKNDRIVACIELKANMGYCRDSAYQFNEEMKEIKKLICNKEVKINFTRQGRYLKENIDECKDIEIKTQIENLKNNKGSTTLYKKVRGNKDVMCMLISLTTANISSKKLKTFEELEVVNFKDKSKENKVFNFITLFNGWYYDLNLKDDKYNDYNLLYFLLNKIDEM